MNQASAGAKCGDEEISFRQENRPKANSVYQSFDALEYVDYVRRRWRIVAVACAVAVLVALSVSLLLPKRYMATASIIIEPPGGADGRGAVVISPMYLESLKTYERFAASDSIFARAVDKFRLQPPDSLRTIEAFKRSILKVLKVRDTTILEISVTLKDPKLAQSLAQYLAEETVQMSREKSRAADQEAIDEAILVAAEARGSLEQAQKAWSSFAVGAPVFRAS